MLLEQAFGIVAVAQLVASMSGVVLGGVVQIVRSILAKGEIFTASIGSVDLLLLSVFIYCVNLHQFLILSSSKAMMFVNLYFRTYFTCILNWIHQAFICELNRCDVLKQYQYRTYATLAVVNINAT